MIFVDWCVHRSLYLLPFVENEKERHHLNSSLRLPHIWTPKMETHLDLTFVASHTLNTHIPEILLSFSSFKQTLEIKGKAMFLALKVTNVLKDMRSTNFNVWDLMISGFIDSLEYVFLILFFFHYNFIIFLTLFYYFILFYLCIFWVLH